MVAIPAYGPIGLLADDLPLSSVVVSFPIFAQGTAASQFLSMDSICQNRRGRWVTEEEIGTHAAQRVQQSIRHRAGVLCLRYTIMVYDAHEGKCNLQQTCPAFPSFLRGEICQ